MDRERFTYFVCLYPNKSVYGISAYTDNQGVNRFISRGQDDRGNPLVRRWKFTPNRRMISVPNSQADVIKHLKDHPECSGSPNGKYRYVDGEDEPRQLGVAFKELNSGKDAEIAIQAMEDKFEATALVIKYRQAILDADKEKLEELRDLAIMCGTTETDPKLQLHSVLQFAENNPQTFIDKFNDPTLKVKALVERGLRGKNTFLRRKGFMIYWHDAHLGNDLDGAIQTLLKDDKLREAIEQDADKTK